MKVIDIQNPCSENWATMTPNEQGAFCNSCQKTVVDFTHKTNNEIFSFLEENSGNHICGRFEKSQLNLLNATYENWEGQSPRVFQSKFVLALLLVFGLGLFSCKGPQQVFNEGYAENTVQIETTDTPIQEQDSVETNYPSGAVATENVLHERMEWMGPVSIIDAMPKFEWPTIMITVEPSIDPWVMGGFVTSGIHVHESTSLTVDYQPPLNELENIFDPPGFAIQGVTNQIGDHPAVLSISIFTESTIEIILRNEKGNDLATVCNHPLTKGEHCFPIDLSGLADGYYFLCIRQNGHEKIVAVSRSRENS